jgi:hypothetical protein
MDPPVKPGDDGGAREVMVRVELQAKNFKGKIKNVKSSTLIKKN